MGATHAKGTECYMKNEVTYASNNAQNLPGIEQCSNVNEYSRSKLMPAIVMYIDNLRPQEADTEGRSKLKDRVVYIHFSQSVIVRPCFKNQRGGEGGKRDGKRNGGIWIKTLDWV